MTKEQAEKIATAVMGQRDDDDPRSSAAFDQMVERLQTDAEYAKEMEKLSAAKA